MSLPHALGIFGAGIVAGTINTVVGSGTLFTFPVLLAFGYAPVTANVSNCVGLVPGGVSGMIGYRRELRGQRRHVLVLAVTSAVGALAGAVLLLVTSERLFKDIVPFLILFACGLLAAQPLLSRVARRPRGAGAQERSARLHVMEFATAAYGGYFGAGLGIMLLAVLALSLDDDLQRLNALKGLLSLLIGAIAAVCFTFFGPVKWVAAAVMAGASLLGGQAGVVLARRLSPRVLRAVVITFGVGVAIVLLR
jgi:uncharacterized membrane protein YfcA